MAKDISRSEEIHTTTIGYELEPYDGGLDPFVYGDEDWPPSAPHCPQCASLLDFEYVAPKVWISGRWDFACADGRIILSERAYEFCLRIGSPEQDFRLLDPKRRLFELWPRQVLKVDIKRSEPRIEDFCTRCANFAAYMFFRGLFFVDVTEPLRDGFYRTDLVFGEAMGKSPIFIAGPGTTAKLKAARFRRLRFRSVPYTNPDLELLQKSEERRREREAALKSKKNGSH